MYILLSMATEFFCFSFSYLITPAILVAETIHLDWLFFALLSKLLWYAPIVSFGILNFLPLDYELFPSPKLHNLNNYNNIKSIEIKSVIPSTLFFYFRQNCFSYSILPCHVNDFFHE